MTSTHEPADERPAIPLWAPRDASWYARPSTRGAPPRWHLAKGDKPMCGRPTLLNMGIAALQPPNQNLRCTRCAAIAAAGPDGEPLSKGQQLMAARARLMTTTRSDT